MERSPVILADRAAVMLSMWGNTFMLVTLESLSLDRCWLSEVSSPLPLAALTAKLTISRWPSLDAGR
eukprot:8877875-Ditylum_brightwellii.AAC.1